MTNKTSTGIGSTGNYSTGNWSTGDCSTGNYSTGDRSTGNRSTGDWSTGDCSTGDCSTGDWSTGNYSTGNYSTGNRSTGNRSTGNRSTGDWSTGNCSTGDCSTGDWSTGNWSTGNYSTGNWSTGNYSTSKYSTGHFCTIDYMGYSCFNKPITKEERDNAYKPNRLYFDLTERIPESKMTDKEKQNNPLYKINQGYLKVLDYKEAFQKSYNNATHEEQQRIKDLPNFDADVFFEISGIRIRDKELTPREIFKSKGRTKQAFEEMIGSK